MDNTGDFKNRLFQLTIIGKTLPDILEDLDKLYDTFFKDYKEEVIQYGNCIFFVSKKETKDIHSEINGFMGEDFGYIIIEVTDNLNQSEFKGNINKTHILSNRFVKLIKDFLPKKQEPKEKKLSLQEKLEIAVENEDYEEASKIRDEILTTS